MTLSIDRAADGFRHETVFYRHDEDFLAGVLPFVRDGLESDEAVIVAAPPVRLDLLRDALADDAGAVQLLDMTEIGLNPARIIAVWQSVVEDNVRAGRALRGVGEPAYPGRREAELLECQLHELLLNRAFDGGPAWRLLCPYDEQLLPAAVCAGAVSAHPIRLTPEGCGPNEGFVPEWAEVSLAEAFGAALPAPSEAVLRGEFTDGTVPAVRRTVRHYAQSCGLSEEQVEALELAASELATNSIRYGGGSGTLALWTEPGAAIVEFSDGGHVADPLTGRITPTLEQLGGRGLYLVNQLCDLVQLRSSPTGTTVRLITWL